MCTTPGNPAPACGAGIIACRWRGILWKSRSVGGAVVGGAESGRDACPLEYARLASFSLSRPGMAAHSEIEQTRRSTFPLLAVPHGGRCGLSLRTRRRSVVRQCSVCSPALVPASCPRPALTSNAVSELTQS